MSIWASMNEAAKKLFVKPEDNPEQINPYQKRLLQQTGVVGESLDQDINPKAKGQKEVHFLNPALDEHRDISRNKHGHYVKTLTYPLPPIKWENRELDKNRRIRNSKNRFLK